MSDKIKLTDEQRQELTEFVVSTYNTIDGNELGDDWWTAHMGFDINIWYDYDFKRYVATVYSIKDGTTNTSVYERLTYL
jgi:hypothetical protein